MEYYASVIRKLQNELGLTISSFPDLGMTEDIYDKESTITEEEESWPKVEGWRDIFRDSGLASTQMTFD